MSHITSLQRKKRPILEFLKYLDGIWLFSKTLQYNRRFYIKGVGGLNLRGGALEDLGSADGRVVQIRAINFKLNAWAVHLACLDVVEHFNDLSLTVAFLITVAS